MTFDQQVKQAHATIAAERAPAYLRRDNDAQKSDTLTEVKQAPSVRAFNMLGYNINEQEQIVGHLYERLAAVLEPTGPCDVRDKPTPFTSAELPNEIAHQAGRVSSVNDSLRDILARLAI